MINKPFVSIIVLNWNEENFIIQCLKSLTNQTYSDKNYEIARAACARREEWAWEFM